jgi:predicted ATPase
MKVAVSGAHGTGKSTLIAGFLERRPEYLDEPEAFETLADDIGLSEGDEPTVEDLRALLEFTVSVLTTHTAEHVIFERSPVDYLAYAAASRRARSAGSVVDFLETPVPDALTA